MKPQDYVAIKDLKEGMITDPIESLDNEGRNGNTVYKIIRLDKIVPAHTASFTEDYNMLLDQAKQAKSMKAIDDFIDSKIKSTYIDGYLKYLNPVTGCIHPELFALSTDTGRMNCRNLLPGVPL